MTLCLTKALFVVVVHVTFDATRQWHSPKVKTQPSTVTPLSDLTMANQTFIDRVVDILSAHPKEVGALAVLIGIAAFYFINRGKLCSFIVKTHVRPNTHSV
jgi:hypothetical protein